MIFYGSKSKHLKTERVTGPTCQYCKNQAPINITIFGKYAHLYWIPFFPLGKTGVSECTHCKKTLAPKEMDTSLKRKYDEINSFIKTPFWFWSGIILILFLFLPSIIMTIFR
ncbi:hypothetical protein JBL43_11330 [Aureibaculum sp. A20]|uniref:Zinc-ribbon domain-containing protein n=1 Tax=Aureibaculum flavum TaxID=2795986 RepID=A0ABS0WS99_9FLAO|nr:hypothetical protein [Aureibaculum flavum]MBJ2174832.1 hypothetical protein [Aureibaculum flavum]